MTGQILFDPLIPWQLLAVVAGLALFGVILAAMRGLSGWALRGLAALVVLGALAGPSYQEEDRAPLSDIVLLLEDESASQGLPTAPSKAGLPRIRLPTGSARAPTQKCAASQCRMATEILAHN